MAVIGKNDICEIDTLHSKVDSHDRQLAQIETIMKMLSENQKEISESTKATSNAIIKFESFLEKQEEHKEETKKSLDKICSNIESLKGDLDKKADGKTIKDLEERLDIVLILSKYPKLAFATGIGLWVLAVGINFEGFIK